MAKKNNDVNINHHIVDESAKKAKAEYEQKLAVSGQRTTSYISEHGLSIFSLILVVLIGVTLIRVLYNGSGDIVSFGSLLDVLRDCPQVSTGVRGFVQQLQLPGPWVVLDGIRTFINFNLSAISIIAWLATSLLDVCLLISHFLMWLFV